MIQGDKEMMVGQWRGMLGRPDDRDHLEEGYSRHILGYFSNPVGDFLFDIPQ